MKDKGIIFLVVLAALVLCYLMFFYTKLDFEISNETISVNIHETIDLKNYVVKAQDNNRKNLIKKVTISADMGDSDSLKDGKLYIGDYSTKTVTFTLKYKFKTVKKTMEIMVISDPNDPDFRPSYEYDSSKSNDDDIPDKNVNNKLTEEQKKYVQSLLN